MKEFKEDKIKNTSSGAGKGLGRDKWRLIKRSYFVDGIWSVSELAEMYGTTKATIGRHIKYYKWKEELEEQIRDKELKDYFDTEKGEKAIEEAIESRKGKIVRQLLDSTTILLEKVQRRVRVIGSTDGVEVNSLVGSLKQLQAMLESLMGGLKDETEEERKVDVRILARVMEVSDMRKENDAKLKKLEEMRMKSEERRLYKQISDIEKKGEEV